MKVVILYRPQSEHAREVESFVHDYKDRHQTEDLELLNVDSRDGWSIASLYDVVTYPAVLALRSDGSLLKTWEGGSLPLMDDLAYYTYGQN